MQKQATATLRAVVALTDGRAEDYALRSLRVGGATHLSAGGATPEVLQREGRWASDAYKAQSREGRRFGSKCDGPRGAR